VSFLSLRGSSATDPHDPLTEDSYLLLSCTTVADTIVLFDYPAGQNPYLAYSTGYDTSDGRSLAGNLRIKGTNYPTKRRLELAFTVSNAMVAVFEAMIEAQRQGETITIADKWNNPTITAAMWIDVADRYRTEIGKEWHLLQFNAVEI
jgi:hypothetical protein